jgi:uncharacterized repeat protein (TIGR01451 family)
MKRLFKRALAALMAVALIAGLTGTAFAAFGPDRPTRVWTPQENGFDHITFNSYTNVGNGIGDERDFLRGVQVGRDSSWSDPVNNVSQGAEVEAKIYIHNDADPLLNTQPDGQGGFKGIARNVTVRVAVPTGSKQTQDATAYISADNAQPGTIYDTLTMSGANNGFFELEYVPGSAKLHKGGTTSALSDNLVTSGVNLGNQNGCFEFVQEVTFRMKVKMPNYSISKQVGIPGQTANDWKESVSAKQGDTVSWLITFKNTGTTELKHVKIVDEVPAGLTVVPGTVKLTNGNYPNGYVYPNSAIQANGRQVNVDIGNYNPNIGAYVSFRTTINKETGQAACTAKSIVNKAFATPEGYGAISDTANLSVVPEQCKPTTPPKELPNTGAGDVVGIFVATTIAGAVAHRYFYGRKFNV